MLESNTGRILALANYPTFEPERFFEAKQDMLKIRAITDPFEPGSVFKPLILCGGIENDLFTPDTLIPYKPTVSVLGRVVTDGAHPIMAKDHASSGLVTATMGITKSSNTCANFVAQSIFAGKRLGGHEYGPANVVPYEGAGRLDVMLRSFGFGQYTGFDLGGTSGGESRGTLPDLAEWTKSTKPNYAIRNVVPSIAQGYQVQVTALQMLCCFNAIATGGVRMKPFVVDKVSARDGRVLFEQLPQVAGHSGISPETAAQMREMLENVVDDGTGQKAHIEGYRLAGKTGTATISTNGGYGENANTCSFVGFAPANDPRISAIVVARHPHKRKVNQYGYPLLPYGGSVAAPYLAEIVERTLVHLGVPRSKEDK
ncbi:MAG: hypothetical protein HUU29_01535 [Planctomycetaceae bacterium]|nr:hypothetical protein [Planctomycetaceae bacterium]